MNLLLDARKKSQEAQAARDSGCARQIAKPVKTPEPGLMEYPHGASSKRLYPESATDEHTPQARYSSRDAGHNLFGAKAHGRNSSHTPLNHNLLLALCGTILPLGIGIAYLWHIDSASNTEPPLLAVRPPAMPTARQPSPTELAGRPQTKLIPKFIRGIAAPTTNTADPPTGDALKTLPPTAPTPAGKASSPTPQTRNSNPARPNNNPIHVEQQKTEPVDPLLKDAYLAYRSGKLEEAQLLYLAMSKKDTQNLDALLGLANIAQQRGENQKAAQYYARALTLDPRNALANAGMSALSADDGRNEGRLKTLLREQSNSPALHFALGNLYAGQSRWGEAQQAYFSAYTLEPGSAEFAFNLAVSLDRLGQKELAVRHYRRAVELDQSPAAVFDHTQVSQRVLELTH